MKRKVTNTPVLAYFDPEKELMLQVDSSKDGLGAAILQGGRPTEFASRALTQAELKWAQIGKETLSLVFGLERFDQYTYGWTVHIQNDHKPLATIFKKPLSQASDVIFQYVQGSQLQYVQGSHLQYIQGSQLQYVQGSQFSTYRAASLSLQTP